MPLSYKIILSIVFLAISFAFGRYTVSSGGQQTITQTQTHTDTQKEEDKHEQTHTVTVITKEPDGAVQQTTTTDTRADDISTARADTTASTAAVTTTSTAARRTLNISALSGYDTQRGTLYYGASFSREVLGPVTLGVFGLTNKTYGVSIGLDF